MKTRFKQLVIAFVFLQIMNGDEFLNAGTASRKDSLKQKPLISRIEDEEIPVDTTPAELKSTTGKSKYDKIIKKDGTVIRCVINEKNLYEVSYINPQTNKMTTISANSVKEIHYATGKTELVDNNPEKAPKDWVVTPGDKDWIKVKITYQQADVESLAEKGPIDAIYESKKMDMTPEAMEKNAHVILKKKAANIGATIVYISSKHINKTYGELPSIEMNGVAYGP
jgi:hypothetical protein